MALFDLPFLIIVRLSRKPRFVDCAAVAVILILGCSTPAIAAQAKPAWQQEWERTTEAAKKEGQVVVYISGYEAVLADFEKEFPEIKVTAVTGRGNQLGPRLLAERRAEKFIADVSSTGASPNYQQYYLGKALDPIRPALMLPEVVDQSNWYLRKHQYSDPEGQYVFNYVASATYGAVNYNTKLVDVKDFKSYWDLLNPKWQGKIAARDIREAGPGAGNTRFFYYHQDLGPAFIRKLFGEMELTLFRDFRQGPDWLATGKYAILLFLRCRCFEAARIAGGYFRPAGVQRRRRSGATIRYRGAGQPRAASECGQSLYQLALVAERANPLQRRTMHAESPADSLRTDIPKNEVPLEQRRLPDIKYLDTGKPEWMDMKPVLDVVNEALRAAGKT